MAPPFDIVSLRNTGDALWSALLLEGEHLGHFRFAAPVGASEAEVHSAIHARAEDFARATSALDQFRSLGQPIVLDDAPVVAERLAA